MLMRMHALDCATDRRVGSSERARDQRASGVARCLRQRRRAPAASRASAGVRDVTLHNAIKDNLTGGVDG